MEGSFQEKTLRTGCKGSKTVSLGNLSLHKGIIGNFAITVQPLLFEQLGARLKRLDKQGFVYARFNNYRPLLIHNQ